MTRQESYKEMRSMKPEKNAWNNSRYPTRAEYMKAAREGRIVQNDKKCVIVSNNPCLQFSLRA